MSSHDEIPHWDGTVPPFEDRPAVPVWRYAEIAKTDDELNALYSKRFGITLFAG